MKAAASITLIRKQATDFYIIINNMNMFYSLKNEILMKGSATMAYTDEQSYEEMISALHSYVSTVEEQCEVIVSAGNDCEENMSEDPAAEKSNSAVQQCVRNIRGALETITAIIAGLQYELEDIKNAANKANSI